MSSSYRAVVKYWRVATGRLLNKDRHSSAVFLQLATKEAARGLRLLRTVLIVKEHDQTQKAEMVVRSRWFTPEGVSLALVGAPATLSLRLVFTRQDTPCWVTRYLPLIPVFDWSVSAGQVISLLGVLIVHRHRCGRSSRGEKVS